MQKLLHCFTTKSKILNLTKLDSNLFYYSTVSDGIKIFSSPESKIIKNIQIENFNAISSLISMSSDAKFIAYSNKNKINIISIETNKIINSIDIDSEVTAINFDISNTYLFVGTSNGGIYQYRYNNNLQLSDLYRFSKNKNNAINIISSYDTKIFLADKYGSLSIVDIYTCKIQELYLKSRLKAISICFLDNMTMIGDARGHLSFFSFKKNRIIKNLITPLEIISQIISTPNKDYILLSGNSNYLTLVNIQTKKISILKYLIFDHKILSISINNDGLLYIALNNNNILNINIYNISELSSLIKQNNMNKAYNLIKSNPILQDSLEYNILENRYKLEYKKATLGLIRKDKTAIIKLRAIYRDVATKQEDIENLDKAFKEYKHLQDLFLEKKYAICYALIDKFPPLKNTIEYKKLEERYKSSLLAAQHQMSIDKQEFARSILKDYITIISKRPIIKPLLENNNEFLAHQDIDKQKAKLNKNTLTFYQAYNHNDFKRCYEILDSNPSLNDLEISKLLNKHYQNIIYKCDEFAINGDIKNVQKELEDLFYISTRKQKIGTLLRVSFRAKMILLINKRVFKEVENLIYSYMDIFGIDSELLIIMKELELKASITLAISEQNQITKDKDAWYYNEYFKKVEE